MEQTNYVNKLQVKNSKRRGLFEFCFLRFQVRDPRFLSLFEMTDYFCHIEGGTLRYLGVTGNQDFSPPEADRNDTTVEQKICA